MNAEPGELIRLELALECIGLDADELLVRIPGANPDEIARYHVYQHTGGYSRFIRHDVPRAIRYQLVEIGPEPAFSDPAEVQRILSQHTACKNAQFFKSYVFPAECSIHKSANVVRLDESHLAIAAAYDPKLDIANIAVFAVIVDGQVVSSCQSSRENDLAGEAWVRTRPPFRRRGFARQVTQAWASDLRQQGKTAFYSHELDNHASEGIATSLGLTQLATLAIYL